MDKDDLHERDIYAWTAAQAATVRELSRRNDLPTGLDLPNIAEEIEDLGINELNAVRSHIRLILVPLMKAISAADSSAKAHWQDEAINWQSELLDRITPAMRTKLDLTAIWRAAIRQAGKSLRAHGHELTPGLASLEGCPLTLDELCSPDFDFGQLLTKLAEAAQERGQNRPSRS